MWDTLDLDRVQNAGPAHTRESANILLASQSNGDAVAIGTNLLVVMFSNS